MRVAIIGTGHVAHHVRFRRGDRSQHRGDRFGSGEDGPSRAGHPPTMSPTSRSFYEGTWRNGRLSFTSDISEVVSDPEVVFVCVGTPAKATVRRA
jgi:hypothetical protein